MRVGARTERAIGGRRLRRRDARLVPVAAAAWLVAGLLTAQAEVSGVVATALWAASAAVLLFAVRRGRAAPACALIAVALAASGAVAMQVAAAQPTRAVVAAADTTGGRALSVMATAVGKIERSATGWRFDAILCRNVLFYLTPLLRTQVLSRLADAMRPGGLLMLGAGETVIGLSNRFVPSARFRGFYELAPARACQSPLGSVTASG